MKDNTTAKFNMLLAMFIFGTIGLFVKYIPLPSAVIALARGFVGAMFLLVFIKVKRQPLDKAAIKANLPRLCISGAALGFNWILLFEAYRYTTVATATLCYYLAPVIVILVSPVVLREKLSFTKIICVAAALLGMVFVSGIAGTHFSLGGEFKGILLGLGAAVLYASIVLTTKKTDGISGLDMTIVQLGISAIVLLPYVLLTQDLSVAELTWKTGLLLAFVAIIHTGLAYALYFGSMGRLKGQTIAILSYIDPIVAIILSALILKEPLGLHGVIGAILVLGATFANELLDSRG